MDRNRSDEKLLEAFKIAQASKDVPEADHHFQSTTMRRIRQIGPLTEKGNGRIMLERFFWHITPVAVSLILFLATCLYKIDFVPENELANLYLTDPVQFEMIETVGL